MTNQGIGLKNYRIQKKTGPPKLKQNKLNLGGWAGGGWGGGPRLQVHPILLQLWGGPGFLTR